MADDFQVGDIVTLTRAPPGLEVTVEAGEECDVIAVEDDTLLKLRRRQPNYWMFWMDRASCWLVPRGA